MSDTKNRTKVDAIQKTGSASRLEKLFADQKAVSISVVLLGFICGTLLILLVGRNPAGSTRPCCRTSPASISPGILERPYIGEC